MQCCTAWIRLDVRWGKIQINVICWLLYPNACDACTSFEVYCCVCSFSFSPFAHPVWLPVSCGCFSPSPSHTPAHSAQIKICWKCKFCKSQDQEVDWEETRNWNSFLTQLMFISCVIWTFIRRHMYAYFVYALCVCWKERGLKLE